MTTLSRGQNQPWPHRGATVLVGGATVGVVLVGADGRAVDPHAWVATGTPARDGVAVAAGGGVRLDLGAVPEVVHRVVVVGTDLVGAPSVRVLGDGEVEVLTFAPGRPEVERALLLVELYRRDGRWKVRAIGQGYAGGLAELAAAHGLTLPAPAPTPAPAPAEVAAPAPASAPGSFVPDPVARLGMITDDASRSTAAYLSSAAFAERRLHDELEQVVGDPALRIGPRGDLARADAQRRHDDLLAQARDRHVADLRLLTAELADLEPSLPAALAGWAAPAWSGLEEADPRGGADAPYALRVGELGLETQPDFRIPMVRMLPLHPALWIETDLGGDDAARRMMVAISQRLTLASPHPLEVSVLDVAGADVWARADLTPVTDPAAVTRVLREHVDHLEVVALAAQSGDWDGLPAQHRHRRVLLVCDVPTGLDEVAVRALWTLVSRGAAGGVDVVVSGSTAPGLDIAVLQALQEHSLRVPSTAGGDLVDGYAQTTWVFHPDQGPADPGLAARVRSTVALHRARA